MELTKLEQIVREITQLLDEQMEALLHQRARGLSSKEKAAYEDRKLRISALRSELGKFRSSQ